MDFALESGRNCSEAGRCDITSVTFHHHGQYAFDLTFHGRFVPPASRTTNAIPPLELPGPALDEDSVYGEPGGLTATLYNDVRTAVLENNGLVPTWHNEDPEPLPEATITAHLALDFGFSSQVEKGPLQMASEQQTRHYQISINGTPSGDFRQANPNEIFSINESCQKIGSSETFEANPGFPTFGQETAFSFNDFNFLHRAETNPNVPLTSSERGFSSNASNFSDNFPTSSQESSFSSSSSIATATSTNSVGSLPTTSSNRLERPQCSICHLTFKRVGDRKRHEKKHFPEERIFHCKESGCEKKGLKGFYRRDKLRAHERQVHGLEN